MFPYFAMVGFPALLSLTGARRLQIGAFLFAVFVLFVALIGLRYEIGPDWFNYSKMVEDYRYLSWAELAPQGEMGWVAMVKLMNANGLGMAGVVFFSAFVFCLGLFAVARMTQEPMLAIVATTPYLAVAVAMSGMRQGIAMGIVYCVIAGWHKSSVVTKIVLILSASLFHFSAILMIGLVAVDSGISMFRKVVISAVVLVIGIYSVSIQTFRVDRYSETYVSGENVVDAPGAILHVALIAVPAVIYFIMRRQWIAAYGRNLLLDVFSALSIVALFTVIRAPAATDRVTLYFSAVAMIIQAGLPMTQQTRGAQVMIRVGIIVMNFVAMMVFLLGANHARSFVPYISIFSEEAQLGQRRL